MPYAFPKLYKVELRGSGRTLLVTFGCLCLLRLLLISLYRPNEPCSVLNCCLHVGQEHSTASHPFQVRMYIL
jgi:hypothetical protein